MHDDLATLRANDLAHAHLLGPQRRPRRGQVHEVDAGNEQDQQRDGRERVDLGDVAVGLHLQFKMRAQVDVFEGLQEEAQGFLAFVAFHELRQLGLQRDGIGLGRQQEVGEGAGPAPTPQRLPDVLAVDRHHRAVRGQHVEVEMGVVRQVFDDARHRQVHPVVVGKSLPEGIGVVEIFAGDGFGEDDAGGLVQRRGRIAEEERHVEDLEKVRVGEEEMSLIKTPFIPHKQRPLIDTDEPDSVDDLWKILLEQVSGEVGHAGFFGVDLLCFEGGADPVDLLGLGKMPVVALFILDEEKDEQAHRQPNSQPQDVDR